MRSFSFRINRALPARLATLGLLALLLHGCATVTSYTDPSGPRFAGGVPTSPVPAEAGSSGSDSLATSGPAAAAADVPVLTVASFNIKEAGKIDSALAVIHAHPELAAADFLLLQEMDARATARIAETLDMEWVYYPATLRNGRDFGNAVLSRWPLVEDDKVLLPHESWFGATRRTATAATALVHGRPVRVYSVHIATPFNQSRGDREDQLRAVLEHASDHEYVVIGGDLNSGSLAEIAVEDGYVWPTEDGPATVLWWRVDHILFRGLVPPPTAASGTIRDNRDASDHLPVWARGAIR